MDTIGTILITGGGAPGSAGILRALRSGYPERKLFSCDVHENTIGRLLADGYFTVHRGDHQDYISDLLVKCTKHGIRKILPITTKEVAKLAQSKATFTEQNIDVIISPAQALHTANDKGLLYTKLQSVGIKVPEFKIAENIEEATQAIDFFQSKQKPFITKPCIGNGSRGFRIINQQVSAYNLLFHHKPNSTHISASDLLKALSEQAFSPILFSEYMPGQEYTVDCLVESGIAKLIIPRSRDKMNSGISVAGEIIYDKEIIDYCHKIINQFNFHGPIGIQVKRDTANRPLLVEINPRIQGTTVACLGAGVNIASLSLSYNLQHISRVNDYPIKWGAKFIRHYVEEYYT